MASSNPMRVGIIGCGVIAPTHVESYQRLNGVEVAWACDVKRERAENLAERFGIAGVTESVERVLADGSVDLVSVCTPHADHADHVEAAFAAGKHVLCEKPLGATNDQIDRMLAAHAAADRLVFGAVFQHRFDGVIAGLRDVVRSGELGTPLLASARLRCLRRDAYYADDWRGTWDREGGSALINQAIHYLDSIAWIMGGVASVMAHYDNRGHVGVIETEDVLTASMRFADGSLGTIETTNASNLNWQNEITVHGTAGAVEVRNGNVDVVRCADTDATGRVLATLEGAADADAVEGSKDYYGSGHPALIADVVDAVRRGREPFVTAESAAHTARVVLAAYESHRTGRRVDLPAPVAARA